MARYSFQSFRAKFEKAVSKGKKLLGDIPLSDLEYAALIDITRQRLSALKATRYSVKEDIVLAVALVRVGMHEYKNGNYWSRFEETLGMHITVIDMQNIGRVFFNTLKFYGLYIYQGEENIKNQYVMNILIHGIVPDDYITDFFEFAFSFYDVNLSRDASVNFREDLKYLISFISESLSNSGLNDEIKVVAAGKTTKVYRLRKATKIALTQFDRRAKNLIRRMVKLIDAKYWDGDLPRKPSSRFTKQFILWAQTSEKFLLTSTEQIRSKQKGEKQYYSPYYRCDFKSGEVFLNIPPQKMKKEDFSDLTYAQVQIGSEIRNIRLDAYSIIGGFKSEGAQIILWDDQVFHPLNVTMYFGKERSFRHSGQDHVIFDKTGNQISSLRPGLNFILARPEVCVDTDAILDKLKFKDYIRYDLNIDDDSIVLIDGIPFSGSGRISEGIGKKGLIHGANASSAGYSSLPVYREHPKLVFKIRNNDLSGIGIILNGRRQRLSDLPESALRSFELNDGSGGYGVQLDIESLADKNNGLYEVIVDIPGEHHRASERHLLLSGLEYSFDGSPYIFADKAVICLSDHHALKPLNLQLRNSNEFVMKLEPDLKYAEFCTVLDSTEWIVAFTVPLMRWKLGNGEWRIDKGEDIWHSDFHGQLLIELPGAAGMELTLNRDPETKLAAEYSQSDKVFKIDIARYRGRIIESRTRHFIELKINDLKLEFMSVLSRCFVQFAVLTCDFASGEINGQFEIIGQAAVVADVFCLTSKKMIVENIEIKDGRLCVKKDLLQGLYQVAVYELEQDEFGLGLNRLQIYKKELELVDPYDLSGQVMRIHSILTGFFLRRPAQNYYVDDLEKSELPGVYIGRLYYLNSKNEKGFCKDINFVRIEFSSIENLTRAHISGILDGEWDDILYDETKREFVMNEDPKVPKRVAYRRYRLLCADESNFKVELKRRDYRGIQTG